MLGDRESVRAERLPVPAGDAREAVRDVLDLDVGGRGVKQVEPAAGQHALPGARAGMPGSSCVAVVMRDFSLARCSLAHRRSRKHPTR